MSLRATKPGHCEELDTVLPPYTAKIREPQVGLMYESCRCQRMIAALGAETAARDPSQVFVPSLHQSGVCGRQRRGTRAFNSSNQFWTTMICGAPA
jgi:hypothetical protein